MSDKFRLKFRELFSSCCCRYCCCCKPIPRMKSTSSAIIQFRSSGLVQHSVMSTNLNQSSTKNKYSQNSTNTLNISGRGGPIKTNANNNNNNRNHHHHRMSRHNGINAYTHNRPICFRLTNV
ncbi:unnamed protein product [Rotaria sp. Silwood2]|nr:unnamed protein product [Rotaria sp. Silwood2]